MNEITSRNIEQFRSFVTRCEAGYSFGIFSFVVLKPPESDPVLLAASIGLTPLLNLEAFVSFSHDSKFVSAGTFYWKVTEERGQLYPLNELAEGLVTNPSDDMRFRFSSDPENDLWSQYDSGENAVQSNQPRAARLTIKGQGLSQAIESIGGMDAIDSDLQSSPIPFNGLQDLFRALGLGVANFRTNPNPPVAEMTIIAQNILVIDRAATNLSDGQILIKCILAKGINRSLVRVGVAPFDGSLAKRFSVAGDQLEWEHQETVDRCALAKSEAAQPPAILVMLTYDNLLFDRWWIFDPKKHVSPTFALHSQWDKDLVELRAYLSGGSKNPADDLEAGVALLLGLLRFSVMHYGLLPKLRDGPDILAFSERNQLLVIECTSAVPTGDKIARLVARVEQIKTSLQQSNHNFIDILPVLVTAVSRDALPKTIADAARHGVLVVAKEQLDEALRRLSIPPSSWELFDELKRDLEAVSRFTG